MSRSYTFLLLPAVVLLAAVSAAAHGNRPHNFGDVWSHWGRDPLTIVGLTVSAVLYTAGVRRLWSINGTGKGIRRWEAAAFAAGWLSLFIALLSPLHPLGEVLFSAHMTQHEVLMLVSAPLLVLGRPLIAALWALPLGWRHRVGGVTKHAWFQRVWRAVSAPFAAWAIHLVVLWVWHLPALFQATLRSDAVHLLQHASFLGSALLFWWALIYGARGLMGYGVAVLYVFSTAGHSGVLGALLTLAATVIYPAYAETAAGFGLTPLEDQQLGGLIMWVPAGVLYTVAGLLLLAGWLRAAADRADRNDLRTTLGTSQREGSSHA